MDKRSLLARIVKSYPAIQTLITGEQSKQESHLLVSWESLERRKIEYRELVEKKIPANSREIAVARSYGDLSENHEYKAAKEMQKLLMKRKADLETQLVRARGTDFAAARIDVASIGTIVHATDLATNQPEHFTILGAWDSDPEKNVVSYLSPVAQALLGHKTGDEVEFEIHGVAPPPSSRVDPALQDGVAPPAAQPARGLKLCRRRLRGHPGRAGRTKWRCPRVWARSWRESRGRTRVLRCPRAPVVPGKPTRRRFPVQ